jgi:hypothetical protein
VENPEYYIKQKNKWYYHYKQLLLATIAYVLANVFDYIITLHGLNYTDTVEANPIAQKYITFFGPEIGLFILKSITVSSVLIGIIGFVILYKNNKTRLKPEYILAAGTAMTFFGACFWFVCF